MRLEFDEKECRDEWERSRAEGDRDLIEQAVPGSLSMHEALHTAYVIEDTFDSHILEHPAIVADYELFAMAYRAHLELFNLYQAIGAKHL